MLLQQHRVSAGLSQEELAERAGLSRRGISDLERGQRRVPHPGTVRRLAEALSLDQSQRATLLASAQATTGKPGGNQPAPETALGFAERLRRARVEARLTQDALAERAGLSVRAISDLERGIHRFPYPDTLDRLIAALGLDEGERARLESLAQRVAAPVAIAGAGADAGARHNLPLQLTSFIGRARERADIHRELAEARLLTLTGPGGMGKTRLALRVAEEELARYPDGIWFVDLAPLVKPALVPQAAATVLGVREKPGEALSTTLTTALHALQVLLILDNCEHVLSGCVDLADTLLRSCPQLRILATSREVLGIGAERVWRVPSLRLPNFGDRSMFEQVAESEAVSLFLERARAVRPEFEPTRQNMATLAQVCRRLDGLPLAIELAAARLKILAVEQLAERLGSHFRVLVSRDRTAPTRQKTLQATIEWSYDLLSDREQGLFDRLSVFAGGCTLEAAEAIGGDDDLDGSEVLDLLERLVDKSLVLAEVSANGPARYRLLETLRQYGQERLMERGESDATRQRHASHFLALTEASELPLLTSADGAWVRRLDAEQDNIRAALHWLIDKGESEGAQRLAGAARRFWFFRGYLAEGRRWLEEVLALDPDGEHGKQEVAEAPSARRSLPATDRRRLSVRAKVLWGIGHLAVADGDLERCRQASGRSVQLYRQLGDTWGTAAPLQNLGGAAARRLDFTEAHRLLEEAVAACQESGQPAILASALSALAEVAREEGDLAAAQRWAEEALRVARTVGFTAQICQASTIFGELHDGGGQHDAARLLWEEALARARETGQRMPFMVPLMMHLGRLAWELGDMNRARPLITEALLLAHRVSRFDLARALEAFVGLVVEGRAGVRVAGGWCRGRLARDDGGAAVANRASPTRCSARSRSVQPDRRRRGVDAGLDGHNRPDARDGSGPAPAAVGARLSRRGALRACDCWRTVGQQAPAWPSRCASVWVRAWCANHPPFRLAPWLSRPARTHPTRQVTRASHLSRS